MEFANSIVHCPDKALTLSLWLWVEDYRDAVIICKEQYPSGELARGYRLMLKTNGVIEFIVHTDMGDAAAESPKSISLKRWFHIAAIFAEDKHLAVYIDGEPGIATQSIGPLMAAKTAAGSPSSLYLGSDTGVRSFFAGKIDEFMIFNRVLNPSEIVAQAKRRFSHVSPEAKY